MDQTQLLWELVKSHTRAGAVDEVRCSFHQILGSTWCPNSAAKGKAVGKSQLVLGLTYRLIQALLGINATMLALMAAACLQEKLTKLRAAQILRSFAARSDFTDVALQVVRICVRLVQPTASRELLYSAAA